MRTQFIKSLFCVILSLSWVWGDCEEGEVELWGECYSIESTDSLNLGSNQLTGSIPPEIGSLTNLTYLNLCCNELTGEIPPEIGELTNLYHLRLDSNQLTGSIPPEIGNLVNLTELWLRYNNLTGEIPSEIGNLTNLTELWLENNQLTGSIPSEIGNLTNLTRLWLISNNLTGEIPETICQLIDNLCIVFLSNNYFCSYVPECLNEWSIGTQFCEDENCETGYSDSDTCLSVIDWSVLQQFIDNSSQSINMYMDDNENGIIEPFELGGQYWENGRLKSLDCYWYGNSCGLSGPILHEIGNLESLTSLNLQGNQLSGEIPSEIGNLTNLTKLVLQENQLTGSIPPEIGNLTNLTKLVLQENQLTGGIPSEIGNLTNLDMFYLSDNQLTGSIPPEIGNLTNLWLLVLDRNQLTGSIPPEIGNLTNLLVLVLDRNQLTGSIPSEIWNLTNLVFLWLNDNQLSGEIPPEIGNLTNLIYLWLNDNQLTGSIPPEIGNLTNLDLLKLHSNQFSSVSDIICNLTNLSWSLEDGEEGDNWEDSNIYNNNLCPPYPTCIIDYLGVQNTFHCIPMSITDILPTHYNLSQPYPNPFNPTTTIQFSLPQSEMVSIIVYDINGKEITTLINDNLSVGYHSVTWNSKHSSGLYFIRMESGGYVESKKVMLLK